MIIRGHRSLLLTKNFKDTKVAIPLGLFGVIVKSVFLVLVKYKGILNKIMNGDPKLLFHIFKVT